MDDHYTETVLRLVEAVPVGCVTTYGDVAAMVGRGGPRQVGTVMSRHGAGVPWWRVVRADGRPAEGLAARALRHLADEGVAAVDGRVPLARVRWRPTPEEVSQRDLGAEVPIVGGDVSG